MADQEAQWKMCFDKFDLDGSGKISAKELANCLIECRPDLDRSTCCDYAVDIMKEADKNDDGNITWAEFKGALEKK